MTQKYYKLTFLSDIVLQGSSNTEGKVETLDYITGSSILGIVAKNYDKFENKIKMMILWIFLITSAAGQVRAVGQCHLQQLLRRQPGPAGDRAWRAAG